MGIPNIVILFKWAVTSREMAMLPIWLVSAVLIHPDISGQTHTIKEDTKVFHPISTTKPPTNYLPSINTQVLSVHVHPTILKLGDDILSKSYLNSIIPILWQYLVR
jgi:hypothetical protein